MKTILLAAVAALSAPALAMAQDKPSGEISIGYLDTGYASTRAPGGNAEGASIGAMANVALTRGDGIWNAQLAGRAGYAGGVDSTDTSLRLGWRNDSLFVGLVGAQSDTSASHAVTMTGVEAAGYWDRVTVAGGVVGLARDNTGAHASAVEGRVTFFPTENLALTARTARVDVSAGADATVWGLEAEGQFKGPFGPVGVYLGFDRNEKTDAETVSVGFRHNWGSGSLRERDRTVSNGGLSANRLGF